MNRIPIKVQIDTFEGPLDLLLYLIQVHELDISKVSISKITTQYLSYIKLIQELDFDIASEFLVMAATLLFWKSKAVLPDTKDASGQNPDQDEPALSQEELIRQLLEHQRFKGAGADLGQLPYLGHDVFTRTVRRLPMERIWKSMEVTSIALCYQDLLVRARKRTQVLRKETVSIADKIQDFSDKLTLGKPSPFSELLSPLKGRTETVVCFLASLELSRLKKLRLHQEKTYEEIYLELLESLKNFDLNLASGFDSIVDAAGIIQSQETAL